MTDNTVSTQHPMWCLTYSNIGWGIITSFLTNESVDDRGAYVAYYLRAPTASAALARAEAMRAGVPEPVAAAVPTIRVRAAIAVLGGGRDWALVGINGAKDSDMLEKAIEVLDLNLSDPDPQIDFATIDVPLRQPAEITGAVEPPKEAP